MNKSTRTLTISASLVALTVMLLYLASFLPSGKIGLTAVAGLLIAAAVIEGGMWAGISCYVLSAVFSFLLIPMKSLAVYYILFFGCYPVIKSLTERAKSRVLEWALKILSFNAALTVLYLLWYYGFLNEANLGSVALILIYAAGNAVFVLYDIAFTRLVRFYMSRIHNKR